ncbi:hypothetical protein DLAC_07957 [Tieghemostelium lacteum]|uniref:Zinc-ribbon 15 domain-containing protein n=1 Tax=Tieghemostelium lacteum TaxID=361077 RepID=A0A151ZAU3_TIELA|nr:hypothetical protein DLAC_07957 [Tieghemostelium lacteum]|eukprot:KYQ91055.1 hypothetical protein DLAC_07957 [Tieghemostelium lacteum]
MWIPIIIPIGVTGKNKLMDNEVRVCVNCHNSGVQLLQNNSYFELFLVPLFKVKSGTPFVHCPTCGCTVPYNNELPEKPKKKKKKWFGRKSKHPEETEASKEVYYDHFPQDAKFQEYQNNPQVYGTNDQDNLNISK